MQSEVNQEENLNRIITVPNLLSFFRLCLIPVIIDWKAEQSDKKVTIAYDPMFRAVMNVIQNAVEHTKENGIIYIDAKEQDDRLTFIVEDSGSGFTKEALLHGTEQFFMDDTSRNGEAHYGMGLFFAKTVAEKYGGGIKLSNSENTGGARVEIFFLSSQETR